MEEPSYCNLSLAMNCTLSLGSTTSRTDIPARLSRAGSPNQNLAWSISVHSDREVPSLDKSDQDVSWGGSSDLDSSPEYYPKLKEKQGRFSEGARKSFKAWTTSPSRSYKDGGEISQALFGMVRNSTYSNCSSPQPWIPSNLPSDEVADVKTAASKVERCMQESDRHVHICAHCGTSKTPLWRNGPGGPKSLCNACGIRFKKAGRRSAVNGNSEESGSLSAAPNFAKRKQVAVRHDPHSWVLSPDAKPRKRSRGSLLRAPHNLIFESCVPWQPCQLTTSPKRSPVSPLGGNHENKLNLQSGPYSSDEEEGAVLLMALSCGVVDA